MFWGKLTHTERVYPRVSYICIHIYWGAINFQYLGVACVARGPRIYL